MGDFSPRRVQPHRVLDRGSRPGSALDSADLRDARPCGRGRPPRCRRRGADDARACDPCRRRADVCRASRRSDGGPRLGSAQAVRDLGRRALGRVAPRPPQTLQNPDRDPIRNWVTWCDHGRCARPDDLAAGRRAGRHPRRGRLHSNSRRRRRRWLAHRRPHRTDHGSGAVVGARGRGDERSPRAGRRDRRRGDAHGIRPMGGAGTRACRRRLALRRPDAASRRRRTGHRHGLPGLVEGRRRHRPGRCRDRRTTRRDRPCRRGSGAAQPGRPSPAQP